MCVVHSCSHEVDAKSYITLQSKHDVQLTAVGRAIQHRMETDARSATQPHPGAQEKKGIFGKPENIAELRVKSKQTLFKAVAIVTPHTAEKGEKKTRSLHRAIVFDY